jgi:hypothetical protein
MIPSGIVPQKKASSGQLIPEVFFENPIYKNGLFP